MGVSKVSHLKKSMVCNILVNESNDPRSSFFSQDLGQKDFGHVTCSTCNMVYTRAQPEDEADHLKFHRKFVTGLRFLVGHKVCLKRRLT